MVHIRKIIHISVIIFIGSVSKVKFALNHPHQLTGVVLLQMIGLNSVLK